MRFRAISFRRFFDPPPYPGNGRVWVWTSFRVDSVLFGFRVALSDRPIRRISRSDQAFAICAPLGRLYTEGRTAKDVPTSRSTCSICSPSVFRPRSCRTISSGIKSFACRRSLIAVRRQRHYYHRFSYRSSNNSNGKLNNLFLQRWSHRERYKLHTLQPT